MSERAEQDTVAVTIEAGIAWVKFNRPEKRNCMSPRLNRQMKKVLEELEFREDGLSAVARRAMERRTGARGLRTILETILLDTMYDLPSMKNVSKVVVDESVVEGHSGPYIVYKSDDARPAAANAAVAAVDEPRRAGGSNH